MGMQAPTLSLVKSEDAKAILPTEFHQHVHKRGKGDEDANTTRVPMFYADARSAHLGGKITTARTRWSTLPSWHGRQGSEPTKLQAPVALILNFDDARAAHTSGSSIEPRDVFTTLGGPRLVSMGHRACCGVPACANGRVAGERPICETQQAR